MPSFSCILTQRPTPLPHVWEHTIGSGHAALALRADWQRQLERCHRELGVRHVRFHGILSAPMDTLTCEQGKWLYSFFNTNQIIDFLLSIGMRPFVELGFMPDDLASGSKTAFHYHANVTPPKDYGVWTTLIRKLLQHWIDRYGAAEVRQWFFEVWNEPNLTVFGSGKLDDYFTLYRSTVEAVKSVDAALRVGGPATAKSEWIDTFVAFCEQQQLPTDFISTHQYPTDAFGSVTEDTEAQLAQTPPAFMRWKAESTRDRAKGRPVYYTEWSTSSNPRDHLHDEPFAAAFAVNILMDVARLVDGYSYWTFSDIFSENYMPSMPFQGGFGLLTLEGVAKPAYRAFELLHHLSTDELHVDGSHPTVRAWCIRKECTVTYLLTNHALPHHPINTEMVDLTLSGIPPVRVAYLQRIDDEHANAKRVWHEMGAPEYPTAHQTDLLHAASCLVKEPIAVSYEERTAHLHVSLSPHAVVAVTIEHDAE